MLAAIGGTLFAPGKSTVYNWIIIAIVVAPLLGVPLAMVPLTAVPQRTALSHAFGGLAAGLVGASEYYLSDQTSRNNLSGFETGALVAEVILGFLTFTGSLMAAASSWKSFPTRPITYKNQNAINLSLFGRRDPGRRAAGDLSRLLAVVPVIVLLGWRLACWLIIPIGGADMPTVIALLNALCRPVVVKPWDSC